MSTYLPEASVLQWLADGQLVNRVVRSVRLWKLVDIIYNYERNGLARMPQEFSYGELRARLYASEHPQSDLVRARNISKNCPSPECICHKTLEEIVFEQDELQEKNWKQDIHQLTGFQDQQIATYLQQYPFATVHRSIREDLKQLVKQGWLKQINIGKYKLVSTLPQSPLKNTSISDMLYISRDCGWSLLRILETMAFIQPNLAGLTTELLQQLTQQPGTKNKLDIEKEPPQRTFIHLDYILAPDKQDLVDNYQYQLEQLWQNPEGAVIQFNYGIALSKTVAKITAYPVCLHYMRRAKYLTAYGIDPHGKVNWHNYRLDRLHDRKLKILNWGDKQVPKQLQQMHDNGKLPTPSQVQEELDKAWGFNFYLPKEVLIMRFPADFAQWYVDDTLRHPTFQGIPYHQIPEFLNKEKVSKSEIEAIVAILAKRSPKDVYYRALVRKGDINVLMRLRDWRPKGEVIAPLSYREILTKEATSELQHYT